MPRVKLIGAKCSYQCLFVKIFPAKLNVGQFVKILPLENLLATYMAYSYIAS